MTLTFKTPSGTLTDPVGSPNSIGDLPESVRVHGTLTIKRSTEPPTPE